MYLKFIVADIEIVTKADLHLLRRELIEDFKIILSEFRHEAEDNKGYKTKHVRKILDCSINKLQSLRIKGTIRSKKIGGTIYYNRVDVDRLMKEGF